MPTLKRVSATPTSVTLRNPENLSQTVVATSSIAPVRRDKGTYNHVKKTIKLSDMVEVKGVCKDACLKSPVVLEYRLSAPEGVNLAEYDKIFKAAFSALGETSLFIPSADVTWS